MVSSSWVIVKIKGENGSKARISLLGIKSCPLSASNDEKKNVTCKDRVSTLCSCMINPITELYRM